jgi:hypothetical protein
LNRRAGGIVIGVVVAALVSRGKAIHDTAGRRKKTREEKMPIDSAELQKARDEAVKQVKKIDELRLSVLKGHFIMVEALDGFLTVALFNPTWLNLDRMNFHTKGNLALALSLGEDRDPWWDVVWALNQLRNKIAHSFDAKEIQEKMKFLRETFLKVLSERQRLDAEKFTDEQIVLESAYVCSGFLALLRTDAVTRRRAIDEYWQPRGPATPKR